MVYYAFFIYDFFYLARNMLWKLFTLLQFPVLFLKIKEIPEEKKNNIRSAYGFLETFLEGNDYLAGNHYTIADMCCIATVSSIVVIFICALIVFLQTKTKKVKSWKNKTQFLRFSLCAIYLTTFDRPIFNTRLFAPVAEIGSV